MKIYANNFYIENFLTKKYLVATFSNPPAETIVISDLKLTLFSDSNIPDIAVKIIRSETPSTNKFFLLIYKFCAKK